MTLQEFKNKYLGKQVEYHSYGAGAYNQCVDLVNAYINQVLDTQTKDYTEIIGTHAKDFNTKYDAEDFDFIANTLTGVPQEGDIIIWNGKAGGGYGHVAIFLEGDAKSFKSLDQNWSQKERVTLETHNYNNITGWLRPKNKEIMVTLPQRELDEIRLRRDELHKENEELKKSIIGYKSRITDLENQLEKNEALLRVAEENAKNYQKQLAFKDVDCQEQVKLKTDEINRLNEVLKISDGTREGLEGRIRVLEGQKEELVKKHTKLKAQVASGIPRGFIKKIVFVFS